MSIVVSGPSVTFTLFSLSLLLPPYPFFLGPPNLSQSSPNSLNTLPLPKVLPVLCWEGQEVPMALGFFLTYPKCLHLHPSSSHIVSEQDLCLLLVSLFFFFSFLFSTLV